MPHSKGQSVMFDGLCCTVFKTPGKRITGETISGYLIRENMSGIIHDNIEDANLIICNPDTMCSYCWGNFEYDGDNVKASKWIFDNLVKCLNSANNLKWGPNIDNTEYHLTIDDTTWTKNLT